MSNLARRIERLETGTNDGDLEQFLFDLHAELFPDAPPLDVKGYRGKSLRAFLKTCRVLRPIILNKPNREI